MRANIKSRWICTSILNDVMNTHPCLTVPLSLCRQAMADPVISSILLDASLDKAAKQQAVLAAKADILQRLRDQGECLSAQQSHCAVHDSRL